VPYARRPCTVCGNLFTPPRASRRNGPYNQFSQRCHDCRDISDPVSEPVETVNNSAGTDMLPPIVQGVFDLETFSLHRNWGVLLVGCIMIHRGGPKPEMHTFTLRDHSKTWPERRGDDGELAKIVSDKLDECHVLYGHNSNRFDVPWMRTLGLKHGFAWKEKKLVDPCALAWKKYALSNNSLQTVANFLNLGHKMPLGEDVWRDALLNNDDKCWRLLVERCESDVVILNRIAARVIGDVGMLDYSGSAFR